MRIFVNLKSYVLAGSGEGAGLISCDAVFDECGLPYIPSRRIKGALKESAMDVCDMLDERYDSVESIFGSDGFTDGKLHISNLCLRGYKEIKEEIRVLADMADSNENSANEMRIFYRNYAAPSKISSHFSSIKQQTAVDEQSETAKENSLRTLRVLKPGLELEGELYEIKPLLPKEKAILYLSALNLKKIGTARNRGFGDVRCFIEGCGFDNVDVGAASVEKAAKVLMRKSEKMDQKTREIKRNGKPVCKFEPTEKGNKKMLPYIITALSPVLISKQKGEQNTVYTLTHIPSTTSRGIFANRFIDLLGLGENAHENKYFYNLFLRGGIIITPAYPFKDGSVYTPARFLHVKKGAIPGDEEVYNILEYDSIMGKSVESISTKPIEKFVCYKDRHDKDAYGIEYVTVHSPKTDFYFHNARDREKGRCVDEGIFYYESINEGERFKGYIIGDEGCLEAIKELLSQDDQFITLIGRSRSAQYGLVKIGFGDLADMESIKDNGEDNGAEFTMVAMSPIVLYNECGFPDISEKSLEHYLQELFGYQAKIKIKKICAKVENLESFVGIWRMKTPRELAFKEGTAFKVSVEGCFDLKNKLEELQICGLGEKTELGFGRVKIYHKLIKKYKKTKKKYALGKDYAESACFQKSADILKEIVKKDITEFYKYKGFENAKELFDGKKFIKEKEEKAPNHLLSTVEAMLLGAKNMEDWEKRIKAVKGKTAGNTLKNIGLMEKLENFDVYKGEYKVKMEGKHYKALEILGLSLEGYSFELSKTYWLSFIRSLRLLKKGESKNGQ